MIPLGKVILRDLFKSELSAERVQRRNRERYLKRLDFDDGHPTRGQSICICIIAGAVAAAVIVAVMM